MIQDIQTSLQCKVRFVHIFRYFIFFLTFLVAQNKDIKISSLDSVEIKLHLDSLLKNQKSYSLEFHLNSYNDKKNSSYYKIIDRGKIADSLIFVSSGELNYRVVKQILQPFKKLFIGNQYSLAGKHIKSKYYFFNNIPDFQYRLYNEQDLAALIFLEPDFQSFISGAFGISRINNQLDIFGELDLDIENFTKNAEQLKIYWKKNKNISQKMLFRYFYPHILGSNMGIQVQNEFDSYNTFFTKSERKILIKSFSPIFNNFKVGYTKGKIKSTNSGTEYGYDDGEYSAISISSYLDNRNNRLLPVSGKFYNLTIDGGLDKQNMFIETNFEHQLFLNLFGNTYGKIKTVFQGISYFENNVPKSRYLRVGGSSSLRGFDENSFSYPQFHILTLELINDQNRPMQIKTFIDFGSNKLLNIKNYLYGYGFGLKQINDETVLGIDYSFSSYKWQDGKIHLKWSTRF